jgi:HD-like signal output (HDOD) protein/signal transduction histidine kinase
VHHAQAPTDDRELILSHIESLPTLSPIALRVLQLSSSPDADIKEIVKLIESDPALTARVLRLCRRADRATANEITTIDRAVVLVGLEAVRAAMLSVEVYGLVKTESDAPATFDRAAFWRHSLAVACCAELLAEKHESAGLGVRPQEAFLCGILHDLGKLALEKVLPKAFGRCVELCEQKRCDIAEIERKVIGLDHHTAGKRLAEHWALPHALQDVIWLHNQPAMSLPDVPHRWLISVVTVAQAITRKLLIGWSGNFSSVRPIEQLCSEHGLDAEACCEIEGELFDRLAVRAANLGLDDSSDSGVLLDSIAEANRQLGQLNSQLNEQAERTRAQQRVLEAIDRFHSEGVLRTALPDAMGAVARSAASTFATSRPISILWQSRSAASWQFRQYLASGKLIADRNLGLPPGGHDLRSLSDQSGMGFSSVEVLGWLKKSLGENLDPTGFRFTPLLGEQQREEPSPGGVLIHQVGKEARCLVDHPEIIRPLLASWASVLGATAQFDGARRLGEQLAEANRQLADTQQQLVETRSLARLGELAGGAAHEMNNPLTVISANAQILAQRLLDDENASKAKAVADAAQRLSDLITSLHLFADPPEPKRTRSDIHQTLDQAVRASVEKRKTTLSALEASAKVEGTLRTDTRLPEIRVIIGDDVDVAFIDRRQIVQAVTEIIVNALEARPKHLIEVRAFVSDADGRLLISVTDDGIGMSERARRHACDPFFSEKDAGRQPGLGLARARRLIDLHGGDLWIESSPGKGATVTVALEDWKWDASRERPRKAA